MNDNDEVTLTFTRREVIVLADLLDTVRTRSQANAKVAVAAKRKIRVAAIALIRESWAK
jgi:hypothetical protein